jgi:hypothetical protein
MLAERSLLLMAGGWVGKFGSSDGQYTRITRLMRTILASRGWSCAYTLICRKKVAHAVMSDMMS